MTKEGRRMIRFPVIFLERMDVCSGPREVICVNYLCGRVYRNIEKEKLIHLQRITGNELDSLFLFEEYIKKKLRGDFTLGL
jgi:hypothetical protein